MELGSVHGAQKKQGWEGGMGMGVSAQRLIRGGIGRERTGKRLIFVGAPRS